MTCLSQRSNTALYIEQVVLVSQEHVPVAPHVHTCEEIHVTETCGAGERSNSNDPFPTSSQVHLLIVGIFCSGGIVGYKYVLLSHFHGVNLG